MAEGAVERPAADAGTTPRRDPRLVGLNWFRELTLVPLLALLVIKAHVNAFIFSLAMSILLTGLQLGWLGGQTVYNLPEAFIYIGAESWFGIPVSVWITVATFVVAALFLRYHRVGRAMYAIGGNLEAARAAGIQVDRIRIGVFMVASILAAVGGLMQAGRGGGGAGRPGRHPIFCGVAAGGHRGGVARRRGRALGGGPAPGVLPCF